ncbi:MAG TPA: GspE/PulE family protein [Fibrobacteraceae bacterium]|nr:GspE/PulE family protein [Fibrobacteraceae bacterium]
MIPSISWSKAHGVAFLSSLSKTESHSLPVAMSDPSNELLIALIQAETSQSITPHPYSLAEIQKYNSLSNPSTESILEKIQLQKNLSDTNVWESEPIIELVDTILESAMMQRVSDIHFEPFETHLSVRFRKDGLLIPHLTLPDWLKDSVILRLKVLACLDISEKRIPLDGRFRFRSPNHHCAIRISTLPTRYGEKAVLRLLLPQESKEDLESLGMPLEMLTKVKLIFEKPQGIFIVTGPTGSGKTSSLYAGLRHIIQKQLNITTIEDPVEYELPGANQVQVNEKAGLHFATALRSVLRQDPDVIFVGEIRDKETACVALQAAQTGHLVLSTLHTNDSVSAISRLKDLGISPPLIADAVLGVLAQRLLRKICPHCKGNHEGCKHCDFTGYKGRFAVFELLEASSKLNHCIINDFSHSQILEEISFLKLTDYANLAVKEKKTTMEELKRVLG